MACPVRPPVRALPEKRVVWVRCLCVAVLLFAVFVAVLVAVVVALCLLEPRHELLRLATQTHHLQHSTIGDTKHSTVRPETIFTS